jgi:hypothetical protein
MAEKMHNLEFDFQEKKALRALVKEIELYKLNNESFKLPDSIEKRYLEICKLYWRQLADEEYEATTFHRLPIR